MKRSFLIGSLLLLVLMSNGCSTGKDESKSQEIVIASANPMTGSSRDAGEMKVKGIQLAFDEVNREGGINGKKLNLLVGDDAGTPKEARKLAEKLATDPTVVAVFGHWNSASTLAVRNVYNGAGIPVITDSVKKVLTDGTTPYLFRILPSDKSEAEQLANYSIHKLKLKKIAIVYVNNDYSVGMKDYFREKFQLLGGEVTAIEVFFEGRTTDFSVEIEKIKNSQPDGLFIAGYYTEAAFVAKQARAMGLTLPILCPNGVNSEELVKLGGEAVEGIKFNGFFHKDIRQNGSEKFADDFKKRYGEEPDSWAALAYDSAQILIAAIRENGDSREGIYRYLTELKEYHGVAGNISFEANHDAEIKLIILTVKDGRIVPDPLQQ